MRLGDAVPQTPWDLPLFPLLPQGSKPGGPHGPPGLLRFARLQSALGSLPSVALPSVHEDRVSEAGGFYEQKELVEARSLWSKRRRENHPSAEREIARIKDLQRAWEMRSQDTEQIVLHEPALIGVGPVEFLAHVLVVRRRATKRVCATTRKSSAWRWNW